MTIKKCIVIIGGARDYHVMDWYRAVRSLEQDRDVRFLTDLIGGEGFEVIVKHDDVIEKLFIIDRFLFSSQNKYGNIWQAIILASKSVVCEVSNVLTGKSVTIDHLADQMMDIVGIDVNKIYQDISMGDPEQSDGTVEKMARLFSIETSRFSKLREGLQETVQYIKSDE